MQSPATRVGVLADDLTGAADCGVAFREAGLGTEVLLDHRFDPSIAARVSVVSSDTRDEPAAGVGVAVSSALAALERRAPALLYKKIDSALRGHVGLELRLVLERTGLPAIVAPALPLQGRTVVGGRGRLHGVPLERTELWGLAGLAGVADVAGLLGAAGVQARLASLAEVRSDRLELVLSAVVAGEAVVCDAESDHDLEAVVRAGLGSGRRILWVGSSGLARHLARRIGGAVVGADAADDREPAEAVGMLQSSFGAADAEFRGPRFDDAGPPDVDSEGPIASRSQRPVTVVVGSAASAARRQLQYLALSGECETVLAEPSTLLADDSVARRALRWGLIEATGSGKGLLVGLEPDGSERADRVQDRRLAVALGRLVGEVADRLGGLVLTGGDTTRVVLGACGERALWLVGEVEPGAAMSVTAPGSRPVVTKAGSFGDDATLLRCLWALRDQARDAGA